MRVGVLSATRLLLQTGLLTICIIRVTFTAVCGFLESLAGKTRLKKKKHKKLDLPSVRKNVFSARIEIEQQDSPYFLLTTMGQG